MPHFVDEGCHYWLDLGNNADSGQFVLGQPENQRNKVGNLRLPTAPELFPELINAKLDKKDRLPPCSALEALERQEPFVNQTFAYRRWQCSLGCSDMDGFRTTAGCESANGTHNLARCRSGPMAADEDAVGRFRITPDAREGRWSGHEPKLSGSERNMECALVLFH